jgi:hypothetical protein
MTRETKCDVYAQWSIYSAIKKNEVMSFVGKWMELKLMLSKISIACFLCGI